VATDFLLATAGGFAAEEAPLWAIAIVSTLIVWRTRTHLLWLLGGGALLGWFGWV
jgi:chromate transporter